MGKLAFLSGLNHEGQMTRQAHSDLASVPQFPFRARAWVARKGSRSSEPPWRRSGLIQWGVPLCVVVIVMLLSPLLLSLLLLPLPLSLVPCNAPCILVIVVEGAAMWHTQYIM